jgi:hypothetical protein
VQPVTLVVTSCNRFDLLERTLTSFFAHNDYPLARSVVIEDSENSGVHAVVARLGRPIDVIVNGERLSQLRSIDRAYATVDTEYIFHLEDDWIFGRGGVIAESVEILDSDPDVVVVMARQRQDQPYYFSSLPARPIAGSRSTWRKIGPRVHQFWFSFSFNPGLRRLSDYRLLPGGYAALGSEVNVSSYYKRMRRSMAWLDDGQVSHIGRGRTTGKPRQKTVAALGAYAWEKYVWHSAMSLQRRTRHYSRLLGLSDGF